MPGGVCEPLSDEEAATLKGILPCIKSVSEGIDKKPTVQFHGCNVQIVNGEGKTNSTNGAGNLVIGYDENPDARPQTGSHDLILGQNQEFTSFGGIVAGFGALWVASEADRTIARIDLRRGAAPRRIDLGASPTALAAGSGGV